MNQDHPEGHIRDAEQHPAAPPPSPSAEAERPAAILDDSRPVKAGRAILLLIVGAIAVAYTGISGRGQDQEKLKQWTNAQAVPSVALVSPQKGSKARELVLPGNVDAFETASIHGQVSGYVREWRTDIGAKVHRGDVLAVVDTPETRPARRCRAKRIREGQGQSLARQSDGVAMEFVARLVGGVSAGGGRKGRGL